MKSLINILVLFMQMVTFIRAQQNIVQKFLVHIGTSAIADLVLKLISVDELPEGSGVVEVFHFSFRSSIDVC
jgi:hypothetical protein